MTSRASGVAGCVALLLFGAPTLAAQVASGHAPLILELPASTAAQAMGNAPYLDGGGADAFFYNPAVLSRARGVAGALQRYGTRATLAGFAGAVGWWGGGVGLGLRALSFEATSVSAAIPPGSEGALYGRGPEGVSELAASVGYGRRLGALSVGAAGTLVEDRVGGERDAGAALALGASVDLGPLSVGLAARNLGPDLELGRHRASLPARVDLGVSTRGLRLGPLDLGAAGSLSRLADGETAPALGVELAYWPVVGRTFLVRGGVRRVPHGPADELSFGAAFEGDDIVLEYAYRGFGGLDGSHRFGIGWR